MKPRSLLATGASEWLVYLLVTAVLASTIPGHDEHLHAHTELFAGPVRASVLVNTTTSTSGAPAWAQYGDWRR